jgi:hypothetical protein
MTGSSQLEKRLRTSLTEQNFRIKDKDDGFAVLAPEGEVTPLNPLGVVNIHTSAFNAENTLNSIVTELRAIGFNDTLDVRPSDFKKKSKTSEQPDLGQVYKKPEDIPGPTDTWITVKDAATYLGYKSPTSVNQYIRDGRIRAVKMPTPNIKGKGLVYFVAQSDLDALKAGARPNGSVKAPVRTHYADTAAGRTTEALNKQRKAVKKITEGIAELLQANEVIEKEAAGALEELTTLRKFKHQMESDLERVVSRF